MLVLSLPTMKAARLALAACMVLALDAQAARIGGAPRAGVRVAPSHFHGGHVRGSVFIGATFGGGYWPGYYYPPYYAPPPPVTAYWYYCAPLNAYYPYVPNCPGPWQLVAPTPYNY